MEFQLTGRRFAIKYKTYGTSDAMVWIDDQPISAQPISVRASTRETTRSKRRIRQLDEALARADGASRERALQAYPQQMKAVYGGYYTLGRLFDAAQDTRLERKSEGLIVVREGLADPELVDGRVEGFHMRVVTTWSAALAQSASLLRRSAA